MPPLSEPSELTSTKTKPVVPIILSGGSGSRLWPKSRKAYPKQLHCLYGEYTMIQHTALRVSHLETPIVVCNEDQRFMVAEQLSEVCEQKPDILLEPVARNTAPAIVAAACFAQEKYGNCILVVLSADHLISDVEKFRICLDIAVRIAYENKLVTFGVPPTSPETGYGYIKARCAKTEVDKRGAEVEAFVEKPNLETAKRYLGEGNYYWNSGMFVFLSGKVFEELRASNTAWLNDCEQSVTNSQADLDFIRLNEDRFAACDDISIDYALMEHTNDAWVVPFSAGWSDLGSWEALWSASTKDEQGNVEFGDAWLKDCRNTLIHGDKKLVAAIGLDNIAVVDTDDALLVINLNHSQSVKYAVDWLKKEKRNEFEHHREVFRPWGSYDLVDEGERFRVNRIEIKPGEHISMQMHHHRAEHWVVVKGTASVTKGGETFLLSENQSTYIPLGERHSIKNPGKLPLYLVEVQSGGYFGDDDVLRVE